MRSSPALIQTAALLLAISCMAASAFGQSAATDPVGFVTLNIPGTNGVGTNAISFKSLGLTTPVVYQGAAEGVNVPAKTLTDSEATWTDSQFNSGAGAYYVEIVRPTGQVTAAPAEGTTYDIASTAASTKTITTVQPLASTLVAGTSFKIRKHWTIGSVFGASNSAGFQGGDGPSTSDVIQVWNGNGFNVYYYQVTTAQFGGTGWRSPNDVFADASSTPLYPDDGLVFVLRQTNAVSVVVMGAVKTGSTSFPITAGTNVIANIYAAPMTLADCGLQASGLAGGDGPSTADQVLLWNGAGYDVYYYQITAAQFGGTGWRSPNDVFADAGATPIQVGTSVIIKRNFGTAFNWVVPQHPASL